LPANDYGRPRALALEQNTVFVGTERRIGVASALTQGKYPDLKLVPAGQPGHRPYLDPYTIRDVDGGDPFLGGFFSAVVDDAAGKSFVFVYQKDTVANQATALSTSGSPVAIKVSSAGAPDVGGYTWLATTNPPGVVRWMTQAKSGTAPEAIPWDKKMYGTPIDLDVSAPDVKEQQGGPQLATTTGYVMVLVELP
jgi:hypothetical protein